MEVQYMKSFPPKVTNTMAALCINVNVTQH